MVSAGLTVTRRSAALRGVGVILAASLMFGSMAVCVRVAAAEVPALQVAFVRFLGSFAVLLAATRGRNLRPRPGNLRPLLLRGLLGGSAISLYYLGIGWAGASLATLLQCTYPVSTAVIATTVLGEPFSSRAAAALVLNLLGVVVVVGPGGPTGGQATLGCLAALGSSLFAGGAVATARHLRASENAALITTYFMAVGAAMTAPALLVGVSVPSPAVALALVGVVLTSVSGQWLLHHGLGYTSATQGSVAAATTVVTAAALESVSFGTDLGPHLIVGSLLMFAAVGLVSRQR
ncbi:DMT family transporter [Candidatus Binatia bacterium]|nr:DMT family transporter [Candidatus Binatia bacterium]